MIASHRKHVRIATKVAIVGLIASMLLGRYLVAQETSPSDMVKPESPENVSGSGNENEIEMLSDIAWELFSNVAAQFLSGNAAELLARNTAQMMSGNEAELLSGNAPELLSGNAPELLSGNSPELLSGNSPELLSNNSPELLSGNEPELLSGNETTCLSGNETEFLSGNDASLFSGNHVSWFSNIHFELQITDSGNDNVGGDTADGANPTATAKPSLEFQLESETSSGAFKSLDRNGDSQLSFAEFQLSVADKRASKAKRKFRRRDRNGDGILTATEFRKSKRNYTRANDSLPVSVKLDE